MYDLKIAAKVQKSFHIPKHFNKKMQFLCIFNDNRRILKQKSVRRRPFTRTNRQLPLSHFLAGEGVGLIIALAMQLYSPY